MNLRILFAYLASLLLLNSISISAETEQPRPLEKVEAEKILLGMDYDRVVVVAVVKGIHQKGISSLNCATVIGLGRRGGKDQEIVQSFFFDRDLGWFYFEMTDGKMRIWNQIGYSEAKL